MLSRFLEWGSCTKRHIILIFFHVKLQEFHDMGEGGMIISKNCVTSFVNAALSLSLYSFICLCFSSYLPFLSSSLSLRLSIFGSSIAPSFYPFYFSISLYLFENINTKFQNDRSIRFLHTWDMVFTNKFL